MIDWKSIECSMFIFISTFLINVPASDNLSISNNQHASWYTRIDKMMLKNQIFVEKFDPIVSRLIIFNNISRSLNTRRRNMRTVASSVYLLRRKSVLNRRIISNTKSSIITCFLFMIFFPRIYSLRIKWNDSCHIFTWKWVKPLNRMQWIYLRIINHDLRYYEFQEVHELLSKNTNCNVFRITISLVHSLKTF